MEDPKVNDTSAIGVIITTLIGLTGLATAIAKLVDTIRKWRHNNAPQPISLSPAAAAPWVMVIDDHEAITTLIKEALEQHGFVVACFAKSAPALELLRRQRFDVAIVDLNLAGDSGFLFIGEATVIDPHMVNVIITGAVAEHTRKRALRLGVVDFIVKPIDNLDLFAERIGNLTNDSRAARILPRTRIRPR